MPQRQPITLLTRFSVYNYPSGIIRKHQKQIRNEADYLREIYGTPRLDAKFGAFETYTVPSIAAQERPADRWLLFTSPQMPAEYLERLRGAVTGIPGAEVVVVRDYDEMLDVADNVGGTTVNLDDDDALHPKYLALLERMGLGVEAPGAPGEGKVLTPQQGYMLYEDGRASRFAYPAGTCAASGLAYNGGNVLRLGNHAAIHARPDAPPILELTPRNLFVRVRHRANLVDRNSKGAKLFPFSFSKYLASELKGNGAVGPATRTLKRKRKGKKDAQTRAARGQ